LAAALSLWGKEQLPLIKEIRDGKAFDPGSRAQWTNMLGNWKRGIKFSDDISSTDRRRITGGETIYFKSCVTCHGPDGKGTGIPGTDLMLAPSLVDSARIKGAPEKLIPVLLHGLTGPIDGKTYQAGFMAPAHVLGITREDRLSELISYIRYVHGNQAAPISKADVIKAKELHKDRKSPWTDKELNELKVK
jgi:mono/diheme cytochrome c family protein